MPLAQPEKFVGYTGNAKAPDSVLLKNNGLHVQLIFDRAHAIGARDQAGLADVVMESALSVIMDLEDLSPALTPPIRSRPIQIGWV